MRNDEILSQISEFCRQADMAESTFGRRAVNDGKLVHRLREGKRITIDTLARIPAYMALAGGVPRPRGLKVLPTGVERASTSLSAETQNELSMASGSRRPKPPGHDRHG